MPKSYLGGWTKPERRGGRGGGGRGHGGFRRGRGRGDNMGGSGESGAPGGWTQPEEGERQRAPRPPGLRGRAIGMYYCNLSKQRAAKEGHKEEPRKNLDHVMSLNIPPAVERRVEHLLKIIMEKREDEISIERVTKIPRTIMTRETKTDLDGTVYKIERPSSTFLAEPKNIKSEDAFNLKLKQNIMQDLDKMLPCSSSSSDSTQSDQNFKKEKVVEDDDVIILDNWEDIEISANKVIVLDDNDDDDDCSIVKRPPVLPMYIENPDLQPNKAPPVIVKKEKVELQKSVVYDFIPLEGKGKKWTCYDEEFKKPDSPKSKKEDDTISVAEISPNTSLYKPLPMRHEGQQYKYGYYDIITGSFLEKLEECLAKESGIDVTSAEIDKLSADYLHDFKNKTARPKFKKMLEFRERLPAFKKRVELLEQIKSSQVIVISGETGCGKSTQVPQIILDDAILNNRGANVKIVVTQPRRIAASSLAKRVSEERAENMGESVGYAIRLERISTRARGCITFCTTGVLLADLEVNQGLTGVSHVILDEVHERDCSVDLAMCMLRQVISKRKDLKLILMSATLDAESLSKYFNNCPTMHIEGLAYPVQDIYMEDILKLTGFTFDETSKNRFQKPRWRGSQDLEKDVQYKMEVGPVLEPRRRELGEKVFQTLLDRRIEELNIDLIFDLLTHICKGPPGAVLVFVPGMTDITKLLKLIESSNSFPRNRYNIYPLHSKLSSLEQNKIFDRPPDGVRKIVVATNIAETSITIDDVVYVVDCAKIKISGLNVADNISTLGVVWVSQANLRQRRGRAGRVQPGVCYHLITSARAEKLDIRLLPELQRSNLLEPVLAIKRLRLGKAAAALKMVPDPPAEESVDSAVKHLKRLGALDEEETLTPLGWHLARLPVHPAAGKLLLFGALFGCLDRAASVAASWGYKDPFVIAIGKEKEADAAKCFLANGEPSDHVAISEALLQWECKSSNRYRFAHENFLSVHTLQLLCDMKQQFAGNLKSMGFLPSGNIWSEWENRNANNLSIFKAVVAAALYPQIGTVRWIGQHRPNPRIILRTPEDGRTEVHPSSVLSQPPKNSGRRICSNPGATWMAYWLKQKSMKLYLFDVTLVHTMPLLFFGELHVTAVEGSPMDCFINISSIKVRCNKNTAQLLVQLKTLLDEVLASRVATPTAVIQHGDFEENILNAVIELITAEDEQNDYADDDGESDQSY